LSYENVKLWFAKDTSEQIITIDEINEQNKNNTYLCPVCGSNLKPKAVKSKQVTSHFAHVDASKCNSESQIHFWFKHKFLEKGDKFTVVADEVTEYVCQDILVEHPYEIENGTYKPDVTILTECGNTISFEMAFTNKKKVKDYLDMWLELKNIVVEVDIKQLMLKNDIPTFKALFYDGKCFNTKRNDTYYNTIGKYKEEKLKGQFSDELKERIRKLDWFWDDILRYNKGEITVEFLTEIVKNIDIEEKFIVYDIAKRNKCSELKDLREYLKEELKKYRSTHRFYYSIDKDSPIKEAVNKLNDFFRNVDSGYKVVLSSNSVRKKAYKYTRYSKIGYWKVEYYYYSVDLRHKLSNHNYLQSLDITTYVKEINNADLIFNYFYEKMKEQVEFYNSKNLKLPKRCRVVEKKEMKIREELNE
jgi:hypothetical protein